jgi:N-acetyl-alpha-D-glucosaminyl L-malate synthase BshA
VSEALAIGVVCYPSFGGSGVVASELAAGLATRGHRVHVIANAPPSRRMPACENLRVHEVAVPHYPPLEYPPYTVAMASAIVRVASEHRLDLLHVHYAVPHAASAYLASQTLGPAAPHVVITLHGTDVTQVGVDASYASVSRFTTAAVDGISVPSAFLKQQTERWLGGAELPPIDVIGNFVDVERFAPPVARSAQRLDALFAAARKSGDQSGGPTLVHVSNFRPVKRVVDVIEVLARVRRQLPARLVLIGDGPERAHVAQRARALGVQEQVCFLGRLIDFSAHLGDADAFLLPSETEGFGLAALEAMSCGVPVFGYRVGGLPELVSEDVGRLVAPLDVAGLAQALLDVLAEPEAHATLGRAARRRAVARFRSGPALDCYESWYRRILGAPPRRILGAPPGPRMG